MKAVWIYCTMNDYKLQTPSAPIVKCMEAAIIRRPACPV
ncbi:Hypothetical protein BIBO2_0657 [Brucella sp. BO2]|nr:Hypothetical protein BIBO2_0657 [Brucella sp. BO2]